VNELTTGTSLCSVSQEVCQDAAKIIPSKLNDTQCGFRCGRSSTRVVTTGGVILRAPNHYEGAKSLPVAPNGCGGAEKSQQCHK